MAGTGPSNAAAKLLCSLTRASGRAEACAFAFRVCLSLGAARRSLPHIIHPQICMEIYRIFTSSFIYIKNGALNDETASESMQNAGLEILD